MNNKDETRQHDQKHHSLHHSIQVPEVKQAEIKVPTTSKLHQQGTGLRGTWENEDGLQEQDVQLHTLCGAGQEGSPGSTALSLHLLMDSHNPLSPWGLRPSPQSRTFSWASELFSHSSGL